MTAPLRNSEPILVDVALGDRSYEIVIGRGQLATLGARVAKLRPGAKVAIVSDENVAARHLGSTVAVLQGQASQVSSIVLPPGESTKSFSHLAALCDELISRRIERGDLVVALGGGVIGDLAGFAAAIVRRGLDYVQVPTSLLAQVDSSVGGKTGVNHPGGKNMIGAFHQPAAVFADTATLRTLPPRELRAGLAEVVKYGLIFDLTFLEWIEANVERLLALDDAALAHAIHRSCELKAEVVQRDERESGDRALLNLGHTFGHAIETGTGYTQWLHGEAVAAGMVVAADMSARLGLLQPADVARVRDLLARIGLPVDPPKFGAQRALDFMSVDKKVKSGRIRLVLLERLGAARFTADYADETLRATLAAHFG
jgi:3-dehydroquinate synthase